MTIPALVATSLLIGASVAYGARVQIRTLQRHVFTTRYFSALMMLELAIILPIGIYFYIFYPDWSWMYLVDPVRLNPAVVPMAMAVYPVAAAMGYLVGYYSARSGSDWVTLMFVIFMAIGLLSLFIAAKNQLLWVGTYEQYHRDVGLAFITSTSVIASILLALAGIGVCWSYLIYRFVKEGRVSSQTL
jgi:hypothetical protein